jgi:hypothetical protein
MQTGTRGRIPQGSFPGDIYINIYIIHWILMLAFHSIYKKIWSHIANIASQRSKSFGHTILHPLIFIFLSNFF